MDVKELIWEAGGEAPRGFEFDANTTDRQPTFYLMTMLMKMCMVDTEVEFVSAVSANGSVKFLPMV